MPKRPQAQTFPPCAKGGKRPRASRPMNVGLSPRRPDIRSGRNAASARENAAQSQTRPT